MNLKNNLINSSIKHANMLIDAFPVTSKPLLFISFFLLLSLYISSASFRKYSAPESARKSQIVRDVAEVINLVCLAFLLAFSIYLLLIFMLAFFAFGLAGDLKHVGFFELLSSTIKAIWIATHNILAPSIIGGYLGAFVGLYLKYFQIPEWSSGEGLTDVKHIADKFSKLDRFNPTPYFDLKKGCFLGLSTDKTPIYVPWRKIRETHIQILGNTGSGKGIVLSSIAYQSILGRESLIWFDPKFDSFSPRIVESAAKLAGKKFYFINLNPDQPPQINPLAGTSAHEIEDLLVTAFDLRGSGTDGDFYRGKDEDAAIEASKLAHAKNALSIPGLIQICQFEVSITAQENFWRKLMKLGDLSVINTDAGLNLEEAILGGAVIYIVGSTDNERVKMLQKLLLVRVNQIIKKKDRFKQNTPICIILDEFKYLLSPTALSGLGVIRDFNAHCLLAHQSLGDLASCPGITRAEAEGAVLDNTAIKIVYKIGDSDYAEKLSRNSGKKRIFVEQVGKSVDNKNLGQGSWREVNVPLIDPDLISHLPMSSDRKDQAAVGVVLGVGISKIFYTGPVPASGILPKVKASPKFSSQAKTDEQGAFNDLI